MAVVSMSKQEFGRLEVLLRVQSGSLRIADACELIGLHRRQVFRLLCGLKQDGAASLLSKRRGKPSNHRLPAEVRTLALSIVRERYPDFGPTLAAEKLAEHHGCSVSRETLRGWMIVDGLGRTVGIVSARRISRGDGVNGWDPFPPWSGWSSYPHALGHPKQHGQVGSTVSLDACTEPYLLMMAQTIIARRQPSWCRCRTAKTW